MKTTPILLLCTLAAAQANEPAPGTLFYNTSYPEASAVNAVGSPPKWLAVADNEMPRIALYSLEKQSTKVHAPELIELNSPMYAVDDLEASTVFPWDVNGDGQPEEILYVYAGSCGRTKKGKIAPDRDALFAVKIDGKEAAAGKATAFTPADKAEYNRTLRSQIRALGSEHLTAPWGKILRDSVSAQGQDAGATNASLAGGELPGLNIEGLSISKDGASLLLGLRSPLVEGKALLIPVTNPVAALGLGESAPQPATLGDPVLLNLGGLGFRSIEWDAARKGYLIVAGSPGDGGAFRLYTWSGEAKDAPVHVTTPSATAAAQIEPEGIAPVPGLQSVVLVGDGAAEARFHKGMWVDPGAGK